MKNIRHRTLLWLFFLAIVSGLVSSCSQVQGYGLLLWSNEEPPIASGTVLPVYIKSNIDKVWVVGVPGTKNKLELPLWKLQFIGSKSKANEQAKVFAEYASVYAETMTDGLPVREDPDNGARRVYRLRQGQIIKVLAKAKGNPAMAGDAPLPGDWLKILTDDGSSGYCFSYRLRLFDQADGAVIASAQPEGEEEDAALEQVLTHVWRPENYKDMVDARQIDLEKFSPRYGFFPGHDAGVAKLAVPGLEIEQSYSGIKKLRDGVWRFEGTSFQVTLRNEAVLAVQYTDTSGAQRTLVFVTLPSDLKDLISQEQDRRDSLYQAMQQLGPTFRSENYGLLTFNQNGTFTWSGYDLLRPAAIPAKAGEDGALAMRLFLDPALSNHYEGAFSLQFSALDPGKVINFLYALEPNGIRLEYVPSTSMDGVVVKRRAASPIVISFVRVER